MSFFKKHVFVCTNQRDDGRECCADSGGENAFDYLRGHSKKQGLIGPDKTRVSKAGCLGRCEKGPVVVVYPAGTWYTYQTEADLQEIIDVELMNDERVTRLLIDPA